MIVILIHARDTLLFTFKWLPLCQVNSTFRSLISDGVMSYLGTSFQYNQGKFSIIYCHRCLIQWLMKIQLNSFLRMEPHCWSRIKEARVTMEQMQQSLSSNGGNPCRSLQSFLFSQVVHCSLSFAWEVSDIQASTSISVGIMLLQQDQQFISSETKSGAGSRKFLKQEEYCMSSSTGELPLPFPQWFRGHHSIAVKSCLLVFTG